MQADMRQIPDFAERPGVAIWELTRSYAHSLTEGQTRRHHSELKGEEIESLLDQVAEIEPGFFVLTGGDLTIRPDILDIVTGATRRGLRLMVSSSATSQLLHADLLAWRRAGVIRMSLDLDGATRASHDAFRAVSGAWNWTMIALQRAREAGIELQINTTFTAKNIDELEEFFALVSRLAPKTWNIFLPVSMERTAVSQMLCGRDTEMLFEKLLAFHHCSGISIKTTEAPHYLRVAQQQTGLSSNPARTRPLTPAHEGRGSIFISHIGEIQPSGFLPITCGNVKCHNLLEVYQNAPVFRALRDTGLLKGKCHDCEYRRICGGSRARAYAVTGDYLAPEPTCVYSPGFQGAFHEMDACRRVE